MADVENRSPTEIEQDIEATRADLDRTIDAIERKLTPGQVVDEVLGYFRSRPGSGSDVVSWLRDNPVPVALIGVGLAWLLFAPRGPGSGRASSGHGRAIPMGPHGERRAPDASVDVARGPGSAALAEDLRRPDIPDTEVSDRVGGARRAEPMGGHGAAAGSAFPPRY